MPHHDELFDLTASGLAEAYASRAVSPAEVTDAALARIEAVNPTVNAIYRVEADSARAAAEAATQRWARGEPLSPLDGVPTVVKDGLDAEGWPNQRGSAADPGHPQLSAVDAPAIARQREAGMVLLGKSTMCDYGMLAAGVSSRHGITRNPWDVSASTSGSSSGTAASVAARICPVAVGTDIVGSVRHPASFCGLFGLKPSQGRVPYLPPGAPGLVAGPFARTLDDLCLLMNVIARPDARDFTALPYDAVDYTRLAAAELSGVTFGYVADIGFGLELDDEVAAAVEAAVCAAAAQGAAVTRLPAPFRPGDQSPVERFYQARYNVELSRLPEGERDKSPVIGPWARAADARTSTELFADMAAAAQMRATAMGLMHGIDFLLMPTVPVPPYAAEAPGHDPDDFFLSWSNTFVFNITEQPAISIPCGFTGDGRPIGLQVVGQRFDDAGVVAVAKAISGALDLADLPGPAHPWPLPEAQPA